MAKMYILFVSLICVIGVPSHGMEVDLCGKTIVVAMTPYYDNGTLNLQMVSKIAKYYADNNITNVHIMEFDGGGALLRLKERIALVTEWLKQRYLGLKFIVEVGLQAFVDTLTLARFCNEQNVSAITHLPEQIYKAYTIEEALDELRSISEVAPNIPLIYNELLTTNPIISVDEVYLAGDEVTTFCGVNTNPNGNNNIEAGTPISKKNNGCKKEIWIYSIQNMYTAFFLGLRSTTLAPNLFPRIVLELEAATDKCDKVKARRLRNKLNRLCAAVANLDGGPINTYYRPFFQNMKAGFELISGIKVGARLPFKKSNRFDKIAGNLRSYGVRLADSGSQ